MFSLAPFWMPSFLQLTPKELKDDYALLQSGMPVIRPPAPAAAVYNTAERVLLTPLGINDIKHGAVVAKCTAHANPASLQPADVVNCSIYRYTTGKAADGIYIHILEEFRFSLM
jgi:hypothetical protein